MKSAATLALCALLCLGYCSRTRGDHHVTVAPTSLPLNPTPLRADGKIVQESTAALPQKPSLTLNSSAAVLLHSTPASANRTDEPAASASADANGNADAAHSAPPQLLPVSLSITVAPAHIATNAPAVPTASVGASGMPQTGSAVSTTTTAANPPTIPVSAGNQTQASKEADPSSKDNSTLSTSPSSTAAPATASPPPTTKPIEAKAESASTTASTTTAMAILPATAPTTTAPTTIPQSSSPVPVHKKPTGSSTPSRSTATTSPTTTITTTTTTTTSSATTTSSLTSSTTTTSPTAAPALSELNVGDDDNSAKGVPDPLLAGLVSVFVVAAAIVSLLVFLKFRKRNDRPEFRRLQDLPMDDMMEDTPLSMFSY